MMEFFTKLNDLIVYGIESAGAYGIIISCLLIMVESMIPILPLSVFITINFLYYGNLVGFILSWICTCLGCILSFFLFQGILQKWVNKHLRNKPRINKFMEIIDNLKFQHLVLLIALPFTPAFMINIAAGISKMKFKKFLPALLIGKIFMVYFWGYVGTTLVESLTNPVALIKVAVILIIAYIVGTIVNKKFKLD